MDERTTSLPAAQETAPRQPVASKIPSLTRQQRSDLIDLYQSEAIQRSDPLSANLGVINGDLMAFANRMREMVDERLSKSPAFGNECDRLRWDVDTYLKCVRQIDRLTRIERQVSAPLSE